MLNWIWGGIVLISLVVSCFTGRLEATSQGALKGAVDAIELSINLLGILCLWTGMSKIGEKSGLIAFVAKIFRPIMTFVFPKLSPDSKAYGSIVMNIVANLLGMGNAATPLGIKAMQELNAINPNKKIPSNHMCMLVVINTASIQLVPTTIISLRQLYGSADSGEIILPVWLVSVFALAVGIFMTKALERRNKL